MKATLALTFILLASTFFSSCSKEKFNYQSDYDKSYHVWQAFKSNSHNSYRYKVVSGSWIGTSWQTVITVTNGKVTQRYYKHTAPTNFPSSSQQEWTEDESHLDTHPQSGALPIWTLDDIYEKAKIDWLQKRDDATTYFETKNNGMISNCGYVPNSCADDCFRGITITLIEAL
ncbi:MAG: hypothetical protein J0I41_22655 [Filimonas sp.]|nr:hypothetical protein [Filimonas sp.]